MTQNPPTGRDDVIAALRSLFDGPPSGAVWGQVCALLDACDPRALEDVCVYAEAHVAGWPDHRLNPRAPCMALVPDWGPPPEPIDPACDLREAPYGWIQAMVAGEDSPKFSLVRRIALHDMGLNGSMAKRLLTHPSLRNLRSLDVGRNNTMSNAFYERLRTSEHLSSLDTLTLRDLAPGFVEALCGEHTLEALRWVTIGGCSKSSLRSLMRASWWSQVQGLHLHISHGYRGSGSLYARLDQNIHRMASLRHLVLSDDDLGALSGSKLWTQLERLSFHGCSAATGVQAIEHLDASASHTVRVLDFGRAAYRVDLGTRSKHPGFARWYQALLDCEHLDRLQTLVLDRHSKASPLLERLCLRCEEVGVGVERAPF